MRIFESTCMLTWHWKGAKTVPMSEEAQNKLTLSMPVLWSGDGTMNFVVVWWKPGSKNKKPKWEYYHDPKDSKKGIWWMQAPSKFTRKETYPQIIRFFLSRNKKYKL